MPPVPFPFFHSEQKTDTITSSEASPTQRPRSVRPPLGMTPNFAQSLPSTQSLHQAVTPQLTRALDPQTESAREARKSFFCELCSKGYSRMNEYEAHESSYDHQHKKRLKEMKQMQRDPLASQKARKAERRADEKSGLITIKPVKLEGQSAATTTTTTGFKKGGFRSAFGDVRKDGVDAGGDGGKEGGGRFRKVGAGGGGGDEGVGVGVGKGGIESVDVESDTEDEGYEYYDPRRPTGCWEGCPGRGSGT